MTKASDWLTPIFCPFQTMKVAMDVMITATLNIEVMVTIKFLVTIKRTIAAKPRAIPIP